MTADNFPAVGYLIESKDGKSVNWIMEIVKAIDKDTSFSSMTNFSQEPPPIPQPPRIHHSTVLNMVKLIFLPGNLQNLERWVI